MTPLSDRIRPNVEAAPWVIEEVVKMERSIDRLVLAADYMLRDMRLRAKIRGDVDPDGTVVLDCGTGVLLALDTAIDIAKKHTDAETQMDIACDLLERFVEANGSVCRLDHHGRCQEHFLEPGGECMVHQAVVFLRRRQVLKI